MLQSITDQGCRDVKQRPGQRGSERSVTQPHGLKTNCTRPHSCLAVFHHELWDDLNAQNLLAITEQRER